MNSAEPIKDTFTFFFEHSLAVNVLSAALCYVFALVIYQVLHRFKVARNDEWAKPFALTFLVLGLLHSLSPLMFLLGIGNDWVLLGYIVSLVAAACSAWTNYLFLQVGVPLSHKSGRIGSKIWRFVQDRPASVKYIQITVIALLSLSAVIAGIGDSKIRTEAAQSGWWLWSRFPDVIFSTPVLWFVGWALSQNISSRRVGRMAWLKWATLAAAFIYGVLFALYGAFPPIVATEWFRSSGLAIGNVADGSDVFFAKNLFALDTTLTSVSVVLKLALFFSALTLILMIADPGSGIRKLLMNVTHGQDEFLDNEGVVRFIQEEIKASRVELYITLPGRQEVARYMWPYTNGAAGNPEELQLDVTADYAQVLNSPGTVVRRGVFNYPDVVPEGVRLREGAAVIAVPVLLHGGSIGCLKAELDGDSFTEAELQNMLRYAALLTPSVENFRNEERSKVLSYRLGNFSRRLTNLQLRARDYDTERDIERVADIAQEVLAPLATGLYIKAGFRRHWACAPTDSNCREEMESRLRDPDADAVVAGDGKGPTFLPKELKVAWGEPGNGRSHEQPVGMLLLALPSQSGQTGRQPTLVSNVFHGQVMSSLITDASLNFIRGSLNEVTRMLGIRMIRLEEASASSGSGEAGGQARRANVPSWFETVDETAREAKLLWAVAKYSDEQEWLGGQVELVKELEGRKDLWRAKVKEDEYEYANNLDIMLHTLTPPVGELSHVIRISLRRSEQVIWLGVGNSAFDLELDYLSPWMGFVLRFGEIAHTNLKQILLKQKQERLEKEAAEAIAKATFAIMTDTFVHQMVNQVRDLTGPIAMLEEAVEIGTLQGNKIHRETILELRESAVKIEALMKRFAGKAKPDGRRPCSLSEAYQHAYDLLGDSLARYNINVKSGDLDGHVVDVPFDVAAYAIANLMNNAKDAIKDARVKNGLIEIGAEPTETMILCHVTDNGPGVPPDSVEKLFETRGNSSKPYGSGMGLYLSAQSLRDNGGNIKLTRPSPPTTFTLCFPKERKG